MPTKSQIAYAAILAFFVQHDIRLRIKSIKAAKAFLECIDAYNAHVEDLAETKEAQKLQIDYLCHLLNEHGIPADKFDLIALNFHN
jgi:hypothetical protein